VVPELLTVVDDPSICNTWDMWGLSCDSCELFELERYRANPPRPSGPKEYRTAEIFQNVKLSHNTKTRICFSEWFGLPSAGNPYGTCGDATEFCEKLCYGLCERISSDVTRPIYELNVLTMRDYYNKPSLVVQLADAMVHTCHYHGLDNLRWHGVGDLNKYSNLVAAAIVTRHPNFVLWGFTRRARELHNLLDMVGGPRHNLVFWCSVDRTTPTQKVYDLCEVAKRCGTGLAYFSNAGRWFRPRANKLPRKIVGVLARQPAQGDLVDDQTFRMWLWKVIQQRGTRMHVAFGYHSKDRTTHLGLPEECPSTDPLAGGHFYASCQFCKWCLMKRAESRTLATHRLATTYVEHGRVYNLDQPEPAR